MLSDQTCNLFCNIFDFKKDDYTIPFDYSIRRAGGEKSRKLSLMHPLTQLACADFYDKYDEYLLNLCSHSPYSIRYISKKAKCIFSPNDDMVIDEGENLDNVSDCVVELDNNNIETRYHSYFSYKKYDLVYKFFESGDNIRLEQKFSHMMTIDVSACFYHIYTHTIAWAVKGRDVAKANIRKKTFEKIFDRLMQRANYNETNGILVGPEISRIFAEIILQAIDLAILRQLRGKGYRLGRDYEIRRYVDDSFIYANSPEILDDIYDVYKEQLAYYKLDINERKREVFTRPFTSGISNAKRQINRMTTEFKEKYLQENDLVYVRKIHNDSRVFTAFVKDFRSITHQFQQAYGSLNKYLLSLILNQIRNEMKKKVVPSQNLLTTYTEVAFFVFSLDMHTTASYRLCSILDCLMRWVDDDQEACVKQELIGRIRREAKRVIDIYQMDSHPGDTNLEVLNLLITLNRLLDFKLPISQVVKLFGLDMEDGMGYSRLNYFQICTLLYVIENDGMFSKIKQGLESEITKRLDGPNQLRKADNAYLFFDIMTCPYVSKSTCQTVVQNCLRNIKYKWSCNRKLNELQAPQRWFFDWDKTHPITEFLEKKEYHPPYE